MRGLKSVPLSASQGVSRLGSLWRLPGENLLPCPVQLLMATCVPWLVAPSSIFKGHRPSLCSDHAVAISSGSDSSCLPHKDRRDHSTCISLLFLQQEEWINLNFRHLGLDFPMAHPYTDVYWKVRNTEQRLGPGCMGSCGGEGSGVVP